MRTPTMRNRYSEIARDLGRRINSGEFAPGLAIPPIDALVQHYGAARMTVRRAVAELCAAGRVRVIHGVGTFVSPRAALSGIVLVTRMDARRAGSDPIRPISDVLLGASHACAEADFSLTTATERQAPEEFLSKDYGFILDFTSRDGEELAGWVQAVQAARAPYISIGEDHGLPNYLGRDTVGGARKALQHLYDLGHRRVAVLTRYCNIAKGPVMFPTPVTPPTGMSLTVKVQNYPDTDPTTRHQMDVKALDALFAESPRPTAVLAGIGNIAQSVLRYCADRGIRVPEDCSVMGYCRDIFAEWNGRKITRVDNPYESIAREAVRCVMETALSGRKETGRRWFEPALVEDDTCGAPRGMAQGH